jgi:hypothetical protein
MADADIACERAACFASEPAAHAESLLARSTQASYVARAAVLGIALQVDIFIGFAVAIVIASIAVVVFRAGNVVGFVVAIVTAT